MVQRLLLAITAICVITLAGEWTPANPFRALDDPPAYEQWIQDLGSNDSATKETARQRVATDEAIPALAQAVSQPNEPIAAEAADVLVRLLDSEDTKTAASADAAIFELEKSANERTRQRIVNSLQLREDLAIMELGLLRVTPRKLNNGYTFQLFDGWQGGDSGLVHLTRLRRPMTLEIALAEEPVLFDRGWMGPSRPSPRRESSDAPQTTVKGLLVLRQMRNLESVILKMPYSNDDIKLLADLPQMRNLSVVFPPDASGADLSHIAKLAQLEELRLLDTPTLGTQLDSLRALPALTSLELVFSRQAGVTDLACLRDFPALESLLLAHVPDVGPRLATLKELPRLKKLTLVGRSVTDADLVHVGKYSTIEELMLQDTAITDDGLAHLESLPTLRSLRLPWSTITDDAVPHLQKLRSLRALNVYGSFVSVAGAAEIRRARGPIAIEGATIDPPPSASHRKAVCDLIRLGGSVRSLGMHDTDNPSQLCQSSVLLGDRWRGGEDSLAILDKLEGLTVLDVQTNLTDSAADSLQHLVGLKMVMLRDTKLTDQGLQFLTKLPNLQSVVLVGPFTDAAVEPLSQTTALKVATQDTLITEAGRQAITKGLERNVQVATRAEKETEMEKYRALAVQACAPLPAERAAMQKVRNDRSRARNELARNALAAIPVLVDLSQTGEGAQRVQALLLLHLFASNMSWGMGSLPNQQEVSVEVQKAFDAIWSWEQSPMVERTDEERALITLGKHGGRVRSPVEQNRGYCIGLFADWSGDDEGLECLKALRPIQRLEMYGATISPNGIAILGALPDLQSLQVGLSDPANTDLTPLQNLRKLTSLTLTTPVHSEALRGLAGMDGLRNLTICGLTDAGLEYVAQVPKLESLSILESPNFNGTGLQHLAKSSQLRRVTIAQATNFTGTGLEYLAAIPTLSELTFHDTGKLGQSLIHLEKMASLQTLAMGSLPITHEGAQHIGMAQQLQQLSIFDSTLMDEDLEHLSALPRLERLTLSANAITDAGIAHLAKLLALQEIRLERTFVTAAGEAKLEAALPNQRQQPPGFEARRQRVTRRVVTPEYMAHVRQLVDYGAGVCSDPAGCRVQIFSHWSGGDTGLSILEQLGDVQGLVVRAPLTDTAVPYLKKLVHLQNLALFGTSISETEIDALREALPRTQIEVPETR
jgi:Leucine-rich repeat (LRR) protein